MIGEWIRFGVTALCVVGGLFALLTALLGLFRFDYALNRLHAAAIADTLALGLVLLGVMVAVGFRAVLWKLVLVLVIQQLPLPVRRGQPAAGGSAGVRRGHGAGEKAPAGGHHLHGLLHHHVRHLDPAGGARSGPDRGRRRRRHHRHPVLPDAAAHRPHRPGCRRGGDARRGGTP